MPLDARKALHILQVTSASFAGRQRSVVIVYRGGSGYSYTLVQVIMRPQQVFDPQVFSSSGQVLPLPADTLLIAPPGTSFSGAVYIADTTSATVSAVEAAAKYEIVEVVPVGIIPSGSHIRVALRRLR